MVKSPGRCQTVGARKKKKKKQSGVEGGALSNEVLPGMLSKPPQFAFGDGFISYLCFFELCFGFYQREINK